MKGRAILLGVILTAPFLPCTARYACALSGNLGVDAVFVPWGKVKIKIPSGPLKYSDQTIAGVEVYGEGMINEKLSAGISFLLSPLKISTKVNYCYDDCFFYNNEENFLGSLYALDAYMKFYLPVGRHKKPPSFLFGVKAGVGMVFFVPTRYINYNWPGDGIAVADWKTYRGFDLTASGIMKINAIKGEKAGLYFQAGIAYHFLRAFLEHKSYMDTQRVLIHMGIGVEFFR